MPTAPDRPQRDQSGVVAELRAGAQLGKYRIVRQLGAGGMGAVYHATHIEIGKAVALKVLAGALARDPRAHGRFLQEAEGLSRLSHPHVVAVTDFGTDAEAPYLVMEFLRGHDLAHDLANTGGLPVDRAVDILLPVCSGIIAVHQAGIVHRDIKPTNIFLAESALREIQPKVLDFGIAKFIDGEPPDLSHTQRGAIVGTPQYMSPEQVKGAPADVRSDQYSLGVVLFECLAGRNPFDGHSHFEVMTSIVGGVYPRLSSLRPDVPPELERHLMRAMAGDPDARFDSILQFGRALLPFASSLPRANWTRFFDAAEASSEWIPSPALSTPRTSLLPTPSQDESRLSSNALSNESWYVNSSTANSALRARSTLRAQHRGAGRRLFLIAAGIASVAAAAFVARKASTGLVEPAESSPADDVGAPKTELPPLVRVNVVGARLAPIEAAPPSPTVSITVDSDPQGAQVWLAGAVEAQGRTPLALPLERSADPRRITLRLAGYQERTLFVVPDTDRAPAVVRLEVTRPAVQRVRGVQRPPARPGAKTPRFVEIED